jgi:predicted NAD-dependent protein-ADP-ribosyltransferase YbiA (DUF1768 family)
LKRICIKYTQNPKLLAELLETGDKILVSEKEIEGLNYILVYDIQIRIGKETKKLDQTLVIQIN